MTADTETRTYRIAHSEKCFRFKPEAFHNHGPQQKGIYELVTFDDNQNANVLYVGAAFDRTIHDALLGHMDGTLEPKADEIFKKYPNLYFDYLTTIGGRTQEDAQDVYWWLVQKHKPAYNDVANIKPSARGGKINVIDEE